ncbi:uncharacterized protein LTR77_004207 [Saxophila tyrrhenica]|uniref:Uncharacterized protein n=1 Tax=Saxophila tyrrhenica TaxID=1690608 RepID=A0AAV9PCW5_9PEZI|nr:hypothetical protein LTR77_004207 [Saxophila tyrrhenica]
MPAAKKAPTPKRRNTPLTFDSIHPQTQALFFTLPAELRNEVYTLVLSIQTNAKGKVELQRVTWRERSVLSIMRTCRWIYTETHGLFHALHHFTFTIGSGATDVIPSVFIASENASPVHKYALEKVTIEVDDLKDFEYVCRALRSCTNLKVLRLSLTKTYSSKYKTLQSDFDDLWDDFLDRRTRLQAAARNLPKSLKRVGVEVRYREMWTRPWPTATEFGEAGSDLAKTVASWIGGAVMAERRRAHAGGRQQIAR